MWLFILAVSHDLPTQEKTSNSPRLNYITVSQVVKSRPVSSLSNIDLQSVTKQYFVRFASLYFGSQSKVSRYLSVSVRATGFVLLVVFVLGCESRGVFFK